MKRLALLCALALSACADLPTETAPHTAPLDARTSGGMMMGGGQYAPPPPTCTDDSGQPVTCP
jgi:hypothetical protein